MDSIKKKEAELLLMRQKVNLLDKELKREQLMESVHRIDEDIELIKNRIQKLESGATQGEIDE